MTETADFAVVGAGIAGAAVAYELAAYGSVLLAEQEPTPGYHTTGRSAALYTEAYETGPVRLLVLASRDHLESPPEGFGEGPLLSPLPVLIVAHRDQLVSLDAIAEAASGFVSVERLNADDTRDLCPVFGEGYIAGSLLEPDSKEIDVHALHQGFLRGARRRGARVLTSAQVTEISPGTSGMALRAGGENISAGVVVNAAGAWSDVVGTMAGAAPKGLQPYRRTAFTFPSGDTDISGWPMVVDADEQFYFKPERGRFLGSLAEETPMDAHDVKPEEADVALAIERINNATTLDIRHVHSTWAGLRTFSPDRMPVVGFDPAVDSFFWLAGQGGYGIMTSPALARLAASLITENRIPEDLASLGFSADSASPARFGD